MNDQVTQRDVVMGIILANEWRSHKDGWFYPRGYSPLIRVGVGVVQYTIQRRHTIDSEWMAVEIGALENFDHRHFEDWAGDWALAA